MNEWYQTLANQFGWYIAMDKNGEVHAFVHKPELNGKWWVDAKTAEFIPITKTMFYLMPEFTGDWDKTLIEPVLDRYQLSRKTRQLNKKSVVK